jgi:plastocyanin
VRVGLAAAAAAVMVVLGACSEDGDSVSLTSDQAYRPTTLTVGAGATVTFVNESDEAHSTTAYEARIPEGADYFASGGFSSEEEARANLSEALIPPGDTYEVTLDVPGTYEYFCIPHEQDGMVGTIVVED